MAKMTLAIWWTMCIQQLNHPEHSIVSAHITPLVMIPDACIVDSAYANKNCNHSDEEC